MSKIHSSLISAIVLVALTTAPVLAEEAVDTLAREDAIEAQIDASTANQNALQAQQDAAQAQDNATQAQQGVSSVSGGLVALELRVAALEALSGSGISSITVDCVLFESIQDAVDLATPGTPLTITVAGTCTEEVVITADDITVQGNNPVIDEVIGGFTITGAHRVTIKDLIIRDDAIGVHASRGASVVLDGLVISEHGSPGQGGTGIFLSRNAYADIIGVDVTNPAGGDNALGLVDGAATRVRASTLISEDSSPFNGAALGLFRSAHARFDGNNTIENTTASADAKEAHAINIADTSNLRVQSGTNDVIGNVLIESNSQADFRGVSFTGQTWIVSQSGATYSGDPSIDGNIFLQEQSTLQAFGAPGSVDVSGTVECADTTSGITDPALSAIGGVMVCTILGGFVFP